MDISFHLGNAILVPKDVLCVVLPTLAQSAQMVIIYHLILVTHALRDAISALLQIHAPNVMMAIRYLLEPVLCALLDVRFVLQIFA